MLCNGPHCNKSEIQKLVALGRLRDLVSEDDAFLLASRGSLVLMLLVDNLCYCKSQRLWGRRLPKGLCQLELKRQYQPLQWTRPDLKRGKASPFHAAHRPRLWTGAKVQGCAR